MKRILLFILLAGNISCLAQVTNYSIHLGTNYTLIGDVDDMSNINTAPVVPASSGYYTVVTNVGTLRHSFQGYMGFNVSGKFDYMLPGRFFITSGLTVNFLRFKHMTRVENLGYENKPITINHLGSTTIVSPMGSFYTIDEDGKFTPVTAEFNTDEKLGKTQAWYLQIPIMAGRSFYNKKLIVRSGLTLSMILHASEYQYDYSMPVRGVQFTNDRTIRRPDTYSSIPTLKVSRQSNTSDFTTVSIGAVLQGTFMLNKNIGIDLIAQRSLSPIYKPETTSVKPVYNTISMGLSYSFAK
jgi:hypothetical protein